VPCGVSPPRFWRLDVEPVDHGLHFQFDQHARWTVDFDFEGGVFAGSVDVPSALELLEGEDGGFIRCVRRLPLPCGGRSTNETLQARNVMRGGIVTHSCFIRPGWSPLKDVGRHQIGIVVRRHRISFGAR
jgi:hypothetical protein